MPGTPSVEELCERLAQRDGLIESLRAELGAALVRIAELEARLSGWMLHARPRHHGADGGGTGEGWGWPCHSCSSSSYSSTTESHSRRPGR
ncbi:MAG: hypothetical protein LC775_13055, partial [Acidobacteria bacterium]|nr:hypothetical protein [Acidobacteriota bacterium]